MFALAALLILYAYHKGLLDKNNNGIPDFLEKGLQVVVWVSLGVFWGFRSEIERAVGERRALYRLSDREPENSRSF